MLKCFIAKDINSFIRRIHELELNAIPKETMRVCLFWDGVELADHVCMLGNRKFAAAESIVKKRSDVASCVIGHCLLPVVGMEVRCF